MAKCGAFGREVVCQRGLAVVRVSPSGTTGVDRGMSLEPIETRVGMGGRGWTAARISKQVPTELNTSILHPFAHQWGKA
eukprot:scaffold57413_cov16-Prasinocladus_malaysianus.AAC.1